MKTHVGFVSNSSSSSFVVAFPEKPTNIKKVRKILFPDFSENVIFHPNDNTLVYPISKVCRTIIEDIKNQHPNDKQRIKDAIVNGWFSSYEGLPGYPHYVLYRGGEDGEKEVKNRANNIIERFLNKYKNSYIYVFYYGDNDGDYYSTLEHGGVFENIPNIRTSYH